MRKEVDSTKHLKALQIYSCNTMSGASHLGSFSCFWAIYTSQRLFCSSLFTVQEQHYLAALCEAITVKCLRQSYPSVLTEEFSEINPLFLIPLYRICFVLFSVYQVHSCTVLQRAEKGTETEHSFPLTATFLWGALTDFKVKSSRRKFFSFARIFPYWPPCTRAFIYL